MNQRLKERRERQEGDKRKTREREIDPREG